MLGAAGAAATTWDAIYVNDKTFDINDTTMTITVSAAVAGFTFNKTNVGAGAVMAITNSGTGNDITGNASNWLVTAAGALTVASVTSTGAITCTAISDNAAGATLQVDGNAGGGVNIGSTSTGAITLGRATTITTGGLTISDTGLTVSGGTNTLIATSNIAASLLLTNNTATTFGTGGADTGVVLYRSTSLTTGSLLSLQLAEGTLAGGFYLRCFDTTAGADNFTVGEDGAVTILGIAGGGTTVLTVTAGDAIFSDGSLAITDADNANSFSVTNNTATTVSVIDIAGSGVFTGVTTASFMEVSASGLTTGTLLRLVAAAATTSVGVVDIATTALTTGSSLRITEATATFTTGGRAIEVALVAATAGNGITVDTTGAYTGTGLLTLTAGAATTGVLLQLTSTTGMTSGSLFRGTTSTAGAVATNGIFSLRATGDYTSTANVGLLDVQATATTAGTIVNVVGNALTTGNALVISGTGVYTGTGFITVTQSGATSGTVMLVTAVGVNSGGVLSLSANGLTTGTMLSLAHTTTVIAAGGSMARIASTSVDTSTTTGCLLDLSSTASTAGTQVLATWSALATGIGMSIVGNALTTGSLLNISHTTTVIAAGGSVARLTSTSIDTSTTTGCILDLVGSGSTAGTQVLETYAALTTGIAHRIVANAVTTGTLFDLETSAAGMAGLYLRCFDGAAVDFSVGVDGRLVVAGTAGITAIAVTAGDITTADGAIASASESVTVGAAAATFAVDSNYVKVTGDAGGNTVTTITGGVTGQLLVLEFQDALVTIANDNTHAANTIDLVGANTTFADDATLTLIFDGVSFYELARSVNA